MNKQQTLIYQSSYDRGLDILLFIWPDVLELYPNAQLHVCYGWNLFDIANRNNPERMMWKKQVQELMKQDGIIHHGRVGQDELAKIRNKCGIWAYPTWFPEINCITALECQENGVVPVTIDDFALSETVGSGIKVKGDIKDFKTQEKYSQELLRLMGDKDRWEKEVKKAKEFAKKFTWDKIAKEWIDVFEAPIENPKVTVYTPIFREGGWEMVADSLREQTYENFEWIIVDDNKKDREDKILKDAKGIDVRYFRGGKATKEYDRPKGLRRANNIAIDNMRGEILVSIQDYISIPRNGLESIVDLYRHNKDALIAPVDTKWTYENGEFKKKVFTNVRVQNRGVRETDNPYDFEMNYGAIPKAILNELNGWWEFPDMGIGHDNVEIAARAMQLGYRVLIDDTNICKAVYMEEAGLSNKNCWDYLINNDVDPVRTKELDEQFYKEISGSNNA